MDKGDRSAMVCGATGPGRLNSNGLPFPQASAIAWRSEPGPLSAVLVTAAAGLHDVTVWVVLEKLGPDVASPLYDTDKNRGPRSHHHLALPGGDGARTLLAAVGFTNTVPVGAPAGRADDAVGDRDPLREVGGSDRATRSSRSSGADRP